jgi:hypothetical protein
MLDGPLSAGVAVIHDEGPSPTSSEVSTSKNDNHYSTDRIRTPTNLVDHELLYLWR